MLRRVATILSKRAKSRSALIVPILEDGTCPVFDQLNRDNALGKQIEAFGGFPKAGQVRNLAPPAGEYDIISVVGKSKDLKESENRDEDAENMRHAVANSVKATARH